MDIRREYASAARRWMLGLPLTVITGLCSAQSRPSVRIPEPIAHWSFDAVSADHRIADDTGNGHDGVVVRSERLTGPFAAELKPGIRGQSLTCGGSQQYGPFLSVPIPPRLDGPFTLTFWMRPSGGQWITRVVYFKHNWLSREGFEIQLSSTRLALVLCPPRAVKETRHWLYADRAVHVKCWSFVGVRWDGSGWTLFLNGRHSGEVTDDELAHAAVAADIPLNLGGYSLRTNNIFCGQIDETRLFGQALTDQQIRQVMLDDIEHSH